MAAFSLKGPLLCFTAAGLSGGQNPPPSSRLRDRRGSAVPSVAWSMGSGARGTKLKAQVAKWVMQNGDYLYDARALHIDTWFSSSAIYIDLLNRTCYRDRELGRTKEVTDQRKRRQEAREKGSRDLVDGLMEYISSDNENYKYIIIANKENANMIMEEGFISSYDRDEILDGLERIEKDIEEGKFQWRNNKDIRTNIIESLIDIVEGPTKRLDAVISHYDKMLTVLSLWCNDSIDKFVNQIKELQLENDVSRLISCKNKVGSTRVTPSGRTDGSMDSLSNGVHHVHNSVMDFGNLIVGDIAHDLTDLENDLHTQLTLSLTPNDEVWSKRALRQ